jgi:hypothetical protein
MRFDTLETDRVQTPERDKLSKISQSIIPSRQSGIIIILLLSVEKNCFCFVARDTFLIFLFWLLLLLLILLIKQGCFIAKLLLLLYYYNIIVNIMIALDQIF